MNEQRLEAYLNLIDALLSYPSEAIEILHTNQHLIDTGLVQVMQQAAAMMEKMGDRNSAEFLNEIARQLAEALELSSSTLASSSLPNTDSQRDFLLNVLQAMVESKGNPEMVYPLLQVNLDKLDDNFATILRNWATAILSSEELEKAQCIVAVISHFSILISEFPLGNRVSNLEIAITGNEVATTVFTRKTFPETWAEIQNNLGEVYRNRICGEKSENLEKAIHCLQDALEIRTCKAFPQDWADTQNNLGAAYIERIQGEKAENLEKAISYFKAALDVFQPEAFRQKWAMTQINLGATYVKRIRGKKAENLEEAIYYLNSALKVLTRQGFP